MSPALCALLYFLSPDFVFCETTPTLHHLHVAAHD